MQMPSLWQVFREIAYQATKGFSPPRDRQVSYIFSRPDSGVVWVLPRGRFRRLQTTTYGAKDHTARGSLGNYELVLTLRKGKADRYYVGDMPIEALDKRIREIESTRE